MSNPFVATLERAEKLLTDAYRTNSELAAALRDIIETCQANMDHSDRVRAERNQPRGPEGEIMYQRVKASTELARAALAKAEGKS